MTKHPDIRISVNVEISVVAAGMDEQNPEQTTVETPPPASPEEETRKKKEVQKARAAVRQKEEEIRRLNVNTVLGALLIADHLHEMSATWDESLFNKTFETWVAELMKPKNWAWFQTLRGLEERIGGRDVARMFHTNALIWTAKKVSGALGAELKERLVEKYAEQQNPLTHVQCQHAWRKLQRERLQ